MKLRNWLPTKFLTEENPVIGLSFEVGYARMAVMVGEAIIFTMSNLIRADHDSVIYNCMPSIRYRQMGGLERDEFVHVHSNHPRGFLQYTGMQRYATYDFFDRLLVERRENKAANYHATKAEIDRMHRRMNTPYLYPSVGTVGHIDHGRFPTYLTRALIEKQAREEAVELGFGELSHTVRKLRNNGHSGVPHPDSVYPTLTDLCRTTPKFHATSALGGMGVVPRVDFKAYMDNVAFRKVGIRLGEKYYFTGEGMLPKDLY